MPVTEPIIHSDPDILGGAPVFAGTRVPLRTLVDYLEAADSLNEFLEDFPSVTREQAVSALRLAERRNPLSFGVGRIGCPMANASLMLKGIIRGKTIELEREAGLPDGQEVNVTVEPVPVLAQRELPPFLADARRRRDEAWEQVKDLPPGEGLRRAFGAAADDAEELDKFIEWVYEQRKEDRPPLERCVPD